MQLQDIQYKIQIVQGQKVMLDFDLATLYEVETKTLNQAVKRNLDRFPEDFMFRLTQKDWDSMRSQFVTASQNKRNTGLTPYAFTEQGIAMLSGVLKSKKAISVNILIMRAFVLIRQHAFTHKDLTTKLKQLENKYDDQFKNVFDAINKLVEKDKDQTENNKRKKIGYKLN